MAIPLQFLSIMLTLVNKEELEIIFTELKTRVAINKASKLIKSNTHRFERLEG